MRKTEIYNWRLDADLKKRLAAAARAEHTTIAALVDQAARQYLERRQGAEDDDIRQQRLHGLARSLTGVHASSDHYSSAKLRERVVGRAARRRPIPAS